MADTWMPRDAWDALYKGKDCPMCAGMKSEEVEDEYGYTVAELERSRLRLVKNQWVAGYCVLIAHKHVCEPFAMHEHERRLFFEDMAKAAAAINQVYQPLKMNYEILGNNIPHLHVHLVPRYYGDPAPHTRLAKNQETRHLTHDEMMQKVGDLREALGLMRVPPNPLLTKWLDGQGRLIDWPGLKHPEQQQLVREYLASKFEVGVDYTEKQVNAILNQWHTFGDWEVLRRELFNAELLGRLKDGSKYWKIDKESKPTS